MDQKVKEVREVIPIGDIIKVCTGRSQSDIREVYIYTYLRECVNLDIKSVFKIVIRVKGDGTK